MLNPVISISHFQKKKRTMQKWQSAKNWLKAFTIRLFNWEYWPMWVVYLIPSFYFAWLSIKARSFFFFTAANPGIENGGMFFESKMKITEKLPSAYCPKTILINATLNEEQIRSQLKEAGLEFPLIAKPDRGERGWMVKKIHSFPELIAYQSLFSHPFLVQEYLDLPVELSIFYFRDPSKPNGIITSVTLKKLLSVTGNGRDTLQTLIMKFNRAFLQRKTLLNNNEINKNQIISDGVEYLLVPYGNHCRGAAFFNFNHIIDPQLEAVFDNISKQVDGFFFGRYDLRTSSIEDLKNGKNIFIMELNGAGAEPAHIYQSGYPFLKALGDICRHYQMMYSAAKQNRNKMKYMSYKEFRELRREEKAYKQSA